MLLCGKPYVADSQASTIRTIRPLGTNWVVTTVAGLVGTPGSADGTGSGARFWEPNGVAVDNAGNLYLADVRNHRITKGTNPAPCVPHAATGIAIVANSSVLRANITDRGCGYTNTPDVLILGGGGIGAQATAVVSNGAVVNIIIIDGGDGYTSVPVVYVAPLLGFGPQITKQPQALTAAIGSRASFSVEASGAPTLTYRWQKNGSTLTDSDNTSGSTATNLTLTTTTASDLGNYTVIITNAYGSTISSAACLHFISSIITPPTASAITYGQTLASSQLSGGVASSDGVFSFLIPSLTPRAGTTNVSVVFTPTDTTNYTAVVINVDVMALQVVVWVNSEQESAFQALLAGEMSVSTDMQTGYA